MCLINTVPFDCILPTFRLFFKVMETPAEKSDSTFNESSFDHMPIPGTDV